MNNTHKFLVSGLLVAAPLGALLTGCGGGSSSDKARPQVTSTPTTTPTTTTTTTTTPTTTPVGTALPELSFTFDNGQRARFFDGRLSTNGVVNAQIAVTGGQSEPLQIPPGTYPVAGTINPATRDFTLSQGAGSAYNFNVTGKLPSSSVDGEFTFTAANGRIEKGNISRGTVVLP